MFVVIVLNTNSQSKGDLTWSGWVFKNVGVWQNHEIDNSRCEVKYNLISSLDNADCVSVRIAWARHPTGENDIRLSEMVKPQTKK